VPFFFTRLRNATITALSADHKEARFANQPGEFLRNHYAYTKLSWFLRQEAHQQTTALVAVSNKSIMRRTPLA
jgi:hypothetical protein